MTTWEIRKFVYAQVNKRKRDKKLGRGTLNSAKKQDLTNFERRLEFEKSNPTNQKEASSRNKRRRGKTGKLCVRIQKSEKAVKNERRKGEELGTGRSSPNRRKVEEKF